MSNLSFDIKNASDFSRNYWKITMNLKRTTFLKTGNKLRYDILAHNRLDLLGIPFL